MRRHRTEAERRRLVAGWRASGKSKWAYSKEHGLALASLARWAAQAEANATAVDFVRLELPARAAPLPSGLVLELGSARVRVERGFDGALLREVVEALAGGRS